MPSFIRCDATGEFPRACVITNDIWNIAALGKSGLKVSALSFGAWVTFAQQITRETATDLMDTAFDAGVNFFDNAEAYASGKAET